MKGGVGVYIFLLVTVDTKSGRSHLFVSVPESVTKCTISMVFWGE